MSIPIWMLAVAAPCLMSLGFLAGEIVAYLTEKECNAAWALLAQRVQELLAKCESGGNPCHGAEMAVIRETMQLLKELNELPSGPADGATTRRRGKPGFFGGSCRAGA